MTVISFETFFDFPVCYSSNNCLDLLDKRSCICYCCLGLLVIMLLNLPLLPFCFLGCRNRSCVHC